MQQIPPQTNDQSLVGDERVADPDSHFNLLLDYSLAWEQGYSIVNPQDFIP